MSEIAEIFSKDVSEKNFDWVESSVRAMHVLCNCSIEASAADLLARKNLVKTVETIFKTLKIKPESSDEKDLIVRSLQLLGKLVRTSQGLS